jgi:hypothetical protein
MLKPIQQSVKLPNEITECAPQHASSRTTTNAVVVILHIITIDIVSSHRDAHSPSLSMIQREL